MGTMKQQQSITTLPPSPEDERRSRMIKYTVTMGIRMVCIVLMLFVQGWWLVVCALGAIILPYFAMIAANVHGEQRSVSVLRPGAVAILGKPEYTGHEYSGHDDGQPGSDAPDPGTDPR
jgi:hypothetical protein